MAELGFRPTEVQYKGSSYGSSCDTFYNRNTVTAGIFILKSLELEPTVC